MRIGIVAVACQVAALRKPYVNGYLCPVNIPIATSHLEDDHHFVMSGLFICTEQYGALSDIVRQFGKRLGTRISLTQLEKFLKFILLW
jgi:hypothetical protein